MKAITLYQPAATLIANLLKWIETRRHNHFACLRGQRIAIHAGKTFDSAYAEMAARYLYRRGPAVLEAAKELDMPQGAIVCTAVVKDARRLRMEDADAALCHAAGLYGLILTDIERLDPPIPARGHQGIWEWTEAH